MAGTFKKNKVYDVELHTHPWASTTKLECGLSVQIFGAKCWIIFELGGQGWVLEKWLNRSYYMHVYSKKNFSVKMFNWPPLDECRAAPGWSTQLQRCHRNSITAIHLNNVSLGMHSLIRHFPRYLYFLRKIDIYGNFSFNNSKVLSLHHYHVVTSHPLVAMPHCPYKFVPPHRPYTDIWLIYL